ncbi:MULTISPECIES: hypothetical protein [Aggregatibacter]|uniref:hypothetical protein n=1 Tax=Aggregatibacter TaxID=416916 RepID=UPI000D6E6D59|nr:MULTISPECIES: hypothetical protein [Aggregatibacter]TYB21581.1 hypothetical protein FXB85_04865 [Aggregatibacter actinomycetemcomitans]
MKPNSLSILCITFIQAIGGIANTRTSHVGEICHVDADYFYPGVWERYGEKELICNYWKFLGDEDRKILESQLNEDENTDTENAVLCSSCTKV